MWSSAFYFGSGDSTYIPVTPAPVVFSNGKTLASMSDEMTPVVINNRSVSVGLSSSVLISDLDSEELSALFGNDVIRGEI